MRTLFAACLACSALHAQQAPQPIVLGERATVRSEVLQQERPYLVYLPPSYKSVEGAGRSFPVVYLLDGGAHFNAVTGVLHHLSSPNSAVGRVPEMIVIALPNMGRTHDFTPTAVASGPYSENSGGASEFLRFLRTELIPEIDRRYRTSPERALIGHSLGGLFALHVFLEQPEAFDHYIALDPSLWWDELLLVRRLAALPQRAYSRPVSVFIAQANSPASDDADSALQRQHEAGIRRFRRLLERRVGPDLRAGFRFFPEETHLSLPLVGSYSGLLFSWPAAARTLP